MSGHRRSSKLHATKPRTATHPEQQQPGGPVTLNDDPQLPFAFAQSCNTSYPAECPSFPPNFPSFLPPGLSPFQPGAPFQFTGMPPTGAGFPFAPSQGTSFPNIPSYPSPPPPTPLPPPQPALPPNVMFLPSSQGSSTPIVLPFPMPMPMPMPMPSPPPTPAPAPIFVPSPPAPAPYPYPAYPTPPPPAPAQDMGIMMLLMNQMRAMSPATQQPDRHSRLSRGSSSEEERKRKKEREKEKAEKKKEKERQKEQKKNDKQTALEMRRKAQEERRAEQVRMAEELKKAQEERRAEESRQAEEAKKAEEEAKRTEENTKREEEERKKAQEAEVAAMEERRLLDGRGEEEQEEPIPYELPEEPGWPAQDVGVDIGGHGFEFSATEAKCTGRQRCCLCGVGLLVVISIILAVVFAMFPATLRNIQDILGIGNTTNNSKSTATTLSLGKYLRGEEKYDIVTQEKTSTEDGRTPNVKGPGWIPKTIVLLATPLDKFYQKDTTTDPTEGRGIGAPVKKDFDEGWDDERIKESLVNRVHLPNSIDTVTFFDVDGNDTYYIFPQSRNIYVTKNGPTISQDSSKAKRTRNALSVHDSKPAISLGFFDDEFADFRRRLSNLVRSSSRGPNSSSSKMESVMEPTTRSVIKELLARAEHERTTTTEMLQELTDHGRFLVEDYFLNRQQINENENSSVSDNPITFLPKGYVTLENYRIFGPPQMSRLPAIFRKAFRGINEAQGNAFRDAITNMPLYVS